MFGACHKDEASKETFGPVVMYNDRTNTIRLIKAKVPMGDPIQRAVIPGVALGEMEPDAEGYGVFEFLKEEVLKKGQPTVH